MSLTRDFAFFPGYISIIIAIQFIVVSSKGKRFLSVWKILVVFTQTCLIFFPLCTRIFMMISFTVKACRKFGIHPWISKNSEMRNAVWAHSSLLTGCGSRFKTTSNSHSFNTQKNIKFKSHYETKEFPALANLSKYRTALPLLFLI